MVTPASHFTRGETARGVHGSPPVSCADLDAGIERLAALGIDPTDRDITDIGVARLPGSSTRMATRFN